jgi:hypothetical protein
VDLLWDQNEIAVMISFDSNTGSAESAERDPSARETLKTLQVQRESVVETQGVFYCHYVTNVTIYL